MNKYKQAFDQVNVDDAMKARILAHIQNEKITGKKTKYLPFWKRFVPAVASLLIVGLIGGILLRKQPESTIGIDPNTQITNPVTIVGSLEELNKIITFENKEIENLPFDITYVEYICYVYGTSETHMAEITYYGQNEKLTYRKSQGEEDNSGIYITYSDTRTMVISETEITFRGEEGIYELAFWIKDGYFYSLYDENGLDESDWQTILEGFID